MANKVAFIVPIHPPHYGFGKCFYKSFIKNLLNETADFYFVFSDKKDANLFGEFKQKIILPEDLLSRCIKNKSHMPDVKKFYALNELKDKYEYLIIADAESRIIKKVNLQEICCNYFANRVLYGNDYRGEKTKFVIDTSLARVPHGETQQDITLDLWFNQPCIYKSKHLEDFFKKTRVLDDIDHLIFGEFDYYMYMFYLIFYKNFKIYNIGVESYYGRGFCEAIDKEEIHIINNNYRNCKFYVATPYIFNLLKPDNKEIFLIHHLDRKTPSVFIKILNFILGPKIKKILINFYSLIKKKCNF